MSKIANTVYDSVAIKLQDGRDITLVPLAIGRLRRFMKAWGAFAEINEDDEAFDIYINCAGIALEKDLGTEFEKTADSEKVLTDEYREFLEDLLDMDTIYKVLDVCGGLKLNDPKLLEEVQRDSDGASGGWEELNLAELEGEALLLGIWKNVAELEECLTLPELELILTASRDQEHRRNKFAAALKGVNLDEDKEQDAKERFDEVQRRVESRLTGVDQRQLDLDVFGIDIELEE